MNRLSILLAEDIKLNARIIVKMMTHAGHAVDVVKNGGEAVDAASTGSYDIVLMDIQMPVMDGVEATRRIRALEGSAAKIPVVALTAYAMVGDREKHLAAGMDDYVSKPIDPAALATAVERQTGVRPALEVFMPAPLD